MPKDTDIFANALALKTNVEINIRQGVIQIESWQKDLEAILKSIEESKAQVNTNLECVSNKTQKETKCVNTIFREFSFHEKKMSSLYLKAIKIRDTINKIDHSKVTPLIEEARNNVMDILSMLESNKNEISAFESMLESTKERLSNLRRQIELRELPDKLEKISASILRVGKTLKTTLENIETPRVISEAELVSVGNIRGALQSMHSSLDKTYSTEDKGDEPQVQPSSAAEQRLTA